MCVCVCVCACVCGVKQLATCIATQYKDTRESPTHSSLRVKLDHVTTITTAITHSMIQGMETVQLT